MTEPTTPKARDHASYGGLSVTIHPAVDPRSVLIGGLCPHCRGSGKREGLLCPTCAATGIVATRIDA